MRAVEARDDTACADVCGMWHRRIAGSCAGRGGRRRGHTADRLPHRAQLQSLPCREGAGAGAHGVRRGVSTMLLRVRGGGCGAAICGPAHPAALASGRVEGYNWVCTTGTVRGCPHAFAPICGMKACGQLYLPDPPVWRAKSRAADRPAALVVCSIRRSPPQYMLHRASVSYDCAGSDR